jgi:hypothetical protein
MNLDFALDGLDQPRSGPGRVIDELLHILAGYTRLPTDLGDISLVKFLC